MKSSNPKISGWLAAALVLISFLVGFLTFRLIYEDKVLSPSAASIQNFSQNLVQTPADCVSEKRQVIVRGDSLSGIVENGDTLKLLVGYYKCHPVERNDLLIYQYTGNQAPLIKIVKAIEGDKFRLKKSATGCGWNILVNDEVLKNSQDKDYCFDETGFHMLSLYEQDYQGVIPRDGLLILGNQTSGSLDSSRFGLIGKENLLGKAIKLSGDLK
jgi:signal peptidase I